MKRDEVKQDFYKLKTRGDVARLLGIREVSLRYFLYKKRPENMYHTFSIAKKDGTCREIAAPDKPLKRIQQKLVQVLNDVYDPKICVYGFVPEKGILDNASQHTKRKLILNIDLKDFFSQIHFGRVRGMFMAPPYALPDEVATTIAQLVCFKGRLPQGAPSSPIITNMICAPLDNALLRFAKRMNCVYTRYADDISISTYKSSFNHDIVFSDQYGVHLGEELLAILKKNSFQVNENKISLRSKYQRQEVTGLTVNAFPNVRRSYIKHVRAILHSCEKYGIHNAAMNYIEKGFCKCNKIITTAKQKGNEEHVDEWFKRVIKGKIYYVGQIKTRKSMTFLSLAKKANRVFREELFDVSSMDTYESIAKNNTYILEYSMGKEYAQGSAFYLSGYGLITSYHVTEDGGIFKVYPYYNYNHKCCGIVCKTENEKYSDKEIDYAIYEVDNIAIPEKTLTIGNSEEISIGDKVTIIGYPKYTEGATPNIQTCTVTGKKKLFNALFYTVSGKVIHGASGGVVLDRNEKAIGIIKGGVESLEETEKSIDQGFVPLHLVFNDVKQKQDNSK